MSRINKTARRYAYRVRHKYRQDPFAFIVLWALFFSAIFLIFAFRGLIATSFMTEIGVDGATAHPDLAPAEESMSTTTEDASPPPTGSGETYTVAGDDTLYGIGLELGKDWQKIAELNNIEPPYSLSVGQVLQLP